MAAARTRFTELSAITGEVDKDYGAGILQSGLLTTNQALIATGIAELDMGLGGGIPEGQNTHIYGYESSGKSTLAGRIAARYLEKNPDRAVVYADFERTFDADWAAIHGIDPDALFLLQPDYAEQGVNIIEGMMESTECGMVIVDSLPAMVPQKIGEIAAEDHVMAIRARLIGRLIEKIIWCTQYHREAGQTPPTSIFVNQWRTKIGVLMGDPRTLPGGQQPQYFASCKLEIKAKPVEGVGVDGVNKFIHKRPHR